MIFVFSVSRHALGSEGAKYLAEALNVNTSMKSLNLAKTGLCGIWSNVGTYDATGIKALADALSVSSSMTSLK